MTAVDPRQLRVWSEEVARDPRSLSFLPLARAYLQADRGPAAIRLCTRGLEHHPSNVEAHALLGRLYREAGEVEKAFDEWDIALRLDPDHAASRREIALLCAERGDWKAARRHLERALEGGPPDADLVAVLSQVRRIFENGDGGREPAKEVAPRSALGKLVARLDEPIRRFVRAARPAVVLLINTSGKLLGQHGVPRSLDPVAVASLGAGIHASSRAIARMLEQDGFHHMYQKGARGHLFLGPFEAPSEELILIAVLSEESQLGLVRMAFASFVTEVGEIPEWSLHGAAQTAETFERDLESGYEHVFGSGRAR